MDSLHLKIVVGKVADLVEVRNSAWDRLTSNLRRIRNVRHNVQDILSIRAKIAVWIDRIEFGMEKNVNIFEKFDSEFGDRLEDVEEVKAKLAYIQKFGADVDGGDHTGEAIIQNLESALQDVKAKRDEYRLDNIVGDIDEEDAARAMGYLYASDLSDGDDDQ